VRARTVATFHQPPQLLERLVDRHVVNCLDVIVVVSEIQRAFFESMVDETRVRTIPLGVDIDFFRAPDSERVPGPFRCITVGHWLRDWGALRSLALLLLDRDDDVELHVVTDRETGLEGLANVRRHRSVSDRRLLHLYQTSDALLLPLTNATANNSLLEGIACGLPVIATKLPAVEVYLEHCQPVLVESNDSEHLLGAITLLRDDEAQRVHRGGMSRAAAEQFSWKRIAGCYIALYEELGVRRRTTSADGTAPVGTPTKQGFPTPWRLP
jgi:glycosyltransferase involved in cell wall biosynthesis